MSYTYGTEEIKINNTNEKTARIAKVLAESLIQMNDFREVNIELDGFMHNAKRSYDAKTGFGTESQALTTYISKDVLSSIPLAKSIRVVIYETTQLWFYLFQERCEPLDFDNDSDILNNVYFCGTEYCDSDEGVDMIVYDREGFRYLDYVKTLENVSDIKEWFCWTPNISITNENQKENAALHEQAREFFFMLGTLFNLDEVDMEKKWCDCWEDNGSISWDGSFKFTCERISTIVSLANYVIKYMQDYDGTKIEFGIYGVPCGKDDYPFAAAGIFLEGETVIDKYCRF